MSFTLRELLANEPDDFVPDLRAWLARQDEQDDEEQQSAGDPSFRAEAGEAAADDAESDGEEMSGCAHGVLTSDVDPALTCGNVRAPDSQSKRREVPREKRTSSARPKPSDLRRQRDDLMKRTRSSLTTEVLKLRRECARTRRKLRDTEERLGGAEVTGDE
ncbi:MAG: hypothetical protein ACTH6A_11115 [Brachybacterium tyrofermentans]|uniref:hypothetical protein n=1 Tax=Brachybacterium tyrofermentans TaxID=47848 RepID=UPI003F90246B